MRDLNYPWQEAVQEAITENNPTQMGRKIYLAEVAIFKRIDRYLAADNGEDAALFQALTRLRNLSEIAGRVYKKWASKQ
jgi:hypothetical protein